MSEKAFTHKLHVRTNEEISFTPETLEKVKGIISHYPEGRQKSALIPILHIAQEELGGRLQQTNPLIIYTFFNQPEYQATLNVLLLA